jgi:hypothetical protein
MRNGVALSSGRSPLVKQAFYRAARGRSGPRALAAPRCQFRYCFVLVCAFGARFPVQITGDGFLAARAVRAFPSFSRGQHHPAKAGECCLDAVPGGHL